MKTLVIGGCGFIGSHVVDELQSRGHFVRVLDRAPEKFRPPVAAVEYKFGDFSDKIVLTESMIGIDTVFHLANTTFPSTADLNPQADARENLIGTIGLLDTMIQLKVGRIVFLSSGGTVYGILDSLPVSEDHPLRPLGSYGIVKVAIEHYLDMYRRLHGLSPLIIRPSNPYGPRQSHTGVQGVISTFLKRVQDNKPIEIWGDGSAVRDYLYVTDLAAICCHAAESGTVGTFNAGFGEGHSLNELIEVVRKVTKNEIKTEYKTSRPLDVPKSVLDVTRAAAAFGWQPKVSLEEGIARSWTWLHGELAS